MDADVVIVGGGIVGLWTAHNLTTQGVKTILFEQFPYPHTRGSSHGQSRVTRTSYSQEMYAALMPEAHRKWRELERATGKNLLVDMGLLTIYQSGAKEENFKSILRSLKKYAPSHEVIKGQELEKRFPGIEGKFDSKGIYEREAGLLKADNCLLALQEWYKAHGGILREREKVLSLTPVSDSETGVSTAVKTYRSRSVVLTCGAYINDLLSSVGLRIPVEPNKQFVYYWKDKSSSKYALTNNFPATMIYSHEDSMYAIPSYEYPGLMKICYHDDGVPMDPNRRDAISVEGEKQKLRLLEFLKSRIISTYTDIDATSPAIEEVCMYTRSPDMDFILDFHPKYKNIVIGAGFSGHGFKTAPAVGHILANLAIGLESPYPLAPFSLERFKTSSKL